MGQPNTAVIDDNLSQTDNIMSNCCVRNVIENRQEEGLLMYSMVK